MAPKGHQIDGALVGRLRTQKLQITQAEMASRLGIHWVTQSNIENGKALVSLELVERIARETGATRDELLSVGAAEASDDDEEAALPSYTELLAALRPLGELFARTSAKARSEHGSIAPTLASVLAVVMTLTFGAA